jgi:hypothetical protein
MKRLSMFKTCLLCKHFSLEPSEQGYSEMTPGSPESWGCEAPGNTPLDSAVDKGELKSWDMPKGLVKVANRCGLFELSDEAKALAEFAAGDVVPD